MKVLVIDDKAANREAAKQTILGHDLTVVGSWDDAVSLLEVRYDEEAIKAKLVAEGFPASSDTLRPQQGQQWNDETKTAINNWRSAYYRIKETCRVPYWDAVLSDLLMPASRETMGPDGMQFAGQEMPVGLVLALLAAKNGAMYVAVVTATNHHHHPASAMLDRLGQAYWCDGQKPNFVINGAQAMFVHHPSCFVEGMPCPECQGAKYTQKVCGYCEGTGQKMQWVDGKRVVVPDAICEGCDGTKQEGCYACSKTGNAEAKDWGKVLARLLDEPVTEAASAS